MLVGLLGDVLVKVNHTSKCVHRSGKFALYCWYCHDWHTLFVLCVILVDCSIRVLLYCTVGTAMTGVCYSLHVFSSRVPVKLTGDVLVGVSHTTRVCLSFW